MSDENLIPVELECGPLDGDTVMLESEDVDTLPKVATFTERDCPSGYAKRLHYYRIEWYRGELRGIFDHTQGDDYAEY